MPTLTFIRTYPPHQFRILRLTTLLLRRARFKLLSEALVRLLDMSIDFLDLLNLSGSGVAIILRLSC